MRCARPFELVLLTLVLALPAAVRAGADDFARGRTVTPASTGPVERIRLPQDVYEWTVREDLGDLRVLDASGVELPFALRAPAALPDAPAAQMLPLFALPATLGAGKSADVRVELAEDGAIVAVHDTSGSAAASAGWLFDAGALANTPLELEFGFAPDTGDLLAQARIEASADLVNWQAVGGAFALVRLGRADAAMLRDSVDLPAPGARYLRIERTDGGPPLPLARVAARPRTSSAPQPDFKTLTPAASGAGFEFDAGGHFPIRLVRVSIDQATYLVRARIASRAAPDAPWREYGELDFYAVGDDGATAATVEPMALPGTTDRFWRVQWADATTAEPRLEIGWIPSDLLFLKQGDPPFVLVYGQGGLDGKPWPMAALLGRLDAGTDPDTLPAATLDAPRMLGGPDRLAPPHRPVDLRMIALWAALGLGVAVIVGLAIRLAR
jgi:hypothetical protein